MDLRAKRFCYVSPCAFFLCGYSAEEVMRWGYGFYPKIVHPDDLPLLDGIHEVVARYLRSCKNNPDKVDYFSCTFRLQRKYPFLSHPLLQMVYCRMKPVIMNGRARYLLCSMASSVIKTVGNLRMYCKDGLGYEAYDSASHKWKFVEIQPLTNQEKAILMLAQQGKSNREMAVILCSSEKTVRNQEWILYRKIGVHSMREAIIFATNHQMIFVAEPRPARQAVGTASGRTRHMLTPEMLLRIQQKLNDRLSVNLIAKIEAISEGAIRYAIKQEKLRRNL
jgi:DNA-binding CsgD family transcriptional regulator